MAKSLSVKLPAQQSKTSNTNGKLDVNLAKITPIASSFAYFSTFAAHHKHKQMPINDDNNNSENYLKKNVTVVEHQEPPIPQSVQCKRFGSLIKNKEILFFFL